MRLLHSHTLQLHEFFRPNVPPYAILSHRWGSEEISFQDMCIINGDRLCKCGLADAKAKLQDTAGYAKIVACCQQAVKDGLNFVWVDTCCIDKSSSAELSEAINSMYQWYKSSSICYAYLNDVTGPFHDVDGDISPFMLVQFKNSKWFTRGWTLQELLAPNNLRFYNTYWLPFGVKATIDGPVGRGRRREPSLTGHISRITGIDEATLGGDVAPWDSVAKKMSWASNRTTTRIEDVAYSLLGIFGVNMPLLYGEGNNAFFRLQTAIMRTSDDQTIFAWDLRKKYYRLPPSTCGLLAPSPSAFAESRELCPFRQSIVDQRSPHQMTARGVRLELELRYESRDSLNCLGLLACGDPRTESQVAIYLQILAETQPDTSIADVHWPAIESALNVKTAARVKPDAHFVAFNDDVAKRYPHKIETVIYVGQGVYFEEDLDAFSIQSTFFISLAQSGQGYRMVKGWPDWNSITSSVESATNHVGTVWLESELKPYPSLMVAIQTGPELYTEKWSAIVATETDMLKDQVERLISEVPGADIRNGVGAKFKSLPELRDAQHISSASLWGGLTVHAEIMSYNLSRRQYMLRINIQGS